MYNERIVKVLEKSTINLQEAAQLLGFKSKNYLREKAKAGKIPGAFKLSRQWMFLTDELMDYLKYFYKDLAQANQIVTKKSDAWHLAKNKIAHTGIPGSVSAELEYKNQRALLLKQRRNDMKRNDDER